MNNLRFYNAQAAFEYYYDKIMLQSEFNNTRSLYNVGFEIINPLDNMIFTPWRKWKRTYAEAEWQWYLSQDRSIVEIGKLAKKWLEIADELNNVNSNYGWQWNRNNQLDKIINMLKIEPTTRRASISIYDGKEIDTFKKDTPCTYAINFRIENNSVMMSVLMRSNDLWFGFCNDQYCFSNLQLLIANKLNLQVGEYFHFTNNLHLYSQQYNKKS